jgi:hypothetical protein
MIVAFQGRMAARLDLEVAQFRAQFRPTLKKDLARDRLEVASLFLVIQHRYPVPAVATDMAYDRIHFKRMVDENGVKPNSNLILP